MRQNKYYKLFTEEELPDPVLRSAVNCYYATLVNCDEHLSHKCKEMDYATWCECPFQTGKKYKGEI